MKRITVMALALFAAAATFASAFDKAWLKGTTDKDPISYAANEKITFTVTAEDVSGAIAEGEWFLSWKRSGDDGLVEEDKIPFTGQPFVYTTTLAKPGFVRLFAQVVDKSGKAYRKPQTYKGDTTTPEGRRAMNRFERRRKGMFFDGGAGVDIAKLTSYPEPPDFDAFWAAQNAVLAAVPIRAKRVEIAKGAKVGGTVYAVSVDCAGARPVTGYLTMPSGAGEKKYPCRLQLHGYDGGISYQRPPKGVYSRGEIVLDINAHGMPLKALGGTEEDLEKLRAGAKSNGFGYAFDPKQNADPKTAYFYGMVLRVKRALQYLKTLPEWDGQHLLASGGSQGGLQTIWAAGCGEGVTRAESGVTWCCDLYTSGKLRTDEKLHLAGDHWYIPWTDALGYYDAVNFAKRIPVACETVITRAGLGDYCCPPTGLAKLWNNIKGNKKITWVQGSEHGYVPPQNYEGRDTVREQK